jgi:hypothetical protein
LALFAGILRRLDPGVLSVRHALLALALGCSVPAVASTFEVDTTSDKPDLTPADGQCLTAQGTCSLRAAIQQANATPGKDVIHLPAGSYLLDLDSGQDEDAAATGDLDIREAVDLIGVPGDSPIGVAIGNRALTFGNQYDRVFDIDTASLLDPVRIEHLSINFGSTHDALGGAGLLLRAGSAMVLRDVVLYANFSASRGSAMAIYGNATAVDLRAFDNHPFAPVTTPNVIGTVYVGGSGSLDAENLALDSNSSEVGGAIAAVDETVVTLRRASISGSLADHRLGSGPDAGQGGGLYLAGQAQVTIENGTLFNLFGLPDDADAINSVVVRDNASLTLRHTSIETLPLRTQGSGTASIRLADSLLFSRQGSGQGCSGNVLSDGGNWLTSLLDCPLAATAQDHVGNALVATDEVLDVPVIGGAGFSRFGLPQQVLLPVDRSVLDQAATASCPAVDQLQATRPSPSASGRPRACDAGAVELPLDHLFVDGWDG